MTGTKRKEREQDLWEAYEIDLRRQRKYEKQREEGMLLTLSDSKVAV